MARSYRKPWVTDGYKGSRNRQYWKNYSNRLIRRTADIPNGKVYRRYLNPWNICDYKWYTGKDDEYFRKTPWKYNRK